MRSITEAFKKNEEIKNKIETCRKKIANPRKGENLQQNYEALLKDLGVERKINIEQQEDILKFLAEKLDFRLLYIIILRYGLIDGQKRSYKQICDVIGCKNKVSIYNSLKRAKKILQSYKTDLYWLLK